MIPQVREEAERLAKSWGYPPWDQMNDHQRRVAIDAAERWLERKGAW